MKPSKTSIRTRSQRQGSAAFGSTVAHCDQIDYELSRQLAEVKRAMVREFGTAISGQSQLLNSALNEAEALAWQTPYPHLLFPVLAQEKACAVSRWAARQRSVQRSSRQMALAA